MFNRQTVICHFSDIDIKYAVQIRKQGCFGLLLNNYGLGRCDFMVPETIKSMNLYWSRCQVRIHVQGN
jgi:hypothetical protein